MSGFVDVPVGDSVPFDCPVCSGKTWCSYYRDGFLFVFVYCRDFLCRWAELYRVV